MTPPLGSARLAVIALLCSLLTTGSPVAQQAVIDSGQLGPLPELDTYHGSIPCALNTQQCAPTGAVMSAQSM